MFGPIYKPHLLMRISKKSSLVGCHNISLYKALTSITKPALPFSLSFFTEHWELQKARVWPFVIARAQIAILQCLCVMVLEEAEEFNVHQRRRWRELYKLLTTVLRLGLAQVFHNRGNNM